MAGHLFTPPIDADFCTSVQNVTAGTLTAYMTKIFFIVMVLWIELRASDMFVLYIPRFRLALNSLCLSVSVSQVAEVIDLHHH